MAQWCIVTPLYNLALDRRASFEFAGGLVLGSLPDWVLNDSAVDRLDSQTESWLREATHAFTAHYDAECLGSPDPAWRGPGMKPIEQTKHELTVLANLALWLSRPSPVRFNVVLYATKTGSRPVVARIEHHPSMLLCHPQDAENSLSTDDIDLARRLHLPLVSLPQDSATWTAVRAAWAALQMQIEEIRYLLFWIALEALFGPHDAREMTYRLAQRISLFLAGDPTEARQLFACVKRAYALRSKVAHGQWRRDPDSTALVAEIESVVRRSLVQLLQNPELMKKCVGNEREAYLDDLAFRKWAGM